MALVIVAVLSVLLVLGALTVVSLIANAPPCFVTGPTGCT